MIDNKAKVGFVFELGFNIGVISSFINKIENEDKFSDLLKDLKEGSNRLDLYNSILDKNNIDKILESNIDNYMFKGYFSGKGFMKEYLNNIKNNEYIKPEYIQVSLNTKNLGKKNEYEIFEHKTILQKHLDVELQDFEVSNLLEKGEFLRADGIFLFSLYDEYYLIIVDNAISIKNLIDISQYDKVKQNYITNIISKRTKSSFSDLGVDVDSLDIDINSKICDYILGLNNSNKGLYKMIQAGSYAYSFLDFLKNYREDIYSKLKIVSIYGYTDTEISSLNLTKEGFLIEEEKTNLIKDNKKLLEQLENELLELNSAYKLSDRLNRKSSLEDKKNNIFLGIQKTFKDKFKAADVRYLSDIKFSKEMNKDNIKIINDKLENFQNTSGMYNEKETFRNEHANLITKALNDKSTEIICLTGNPGIGKTTAIVNSLKEKDNFLFIYVSPRTQVNKDIEEKFLQDKTSTRELYDKKAVYLTADSNDETVINRTEVEVVNYNSQNKAFNKDNYDVKFLDINRNREKREEKNDKYGALDDRRIKKFQNINSGVLKRLTKGIKTTIDYNLSNKIIATVSMQSLKSVGSKKTTMHINRIFEDIHNEKTKSLNIENFKVFASKINNIVIMIDEITVTNSL